MERVKFRYTAMQQALETLDEGMKEMLIPLADRPNAYKLMRDGVTQRFEYSIDTFWKFLKFYMELESKVSLESTAPKVVLKQAAHLMFMS